MTDVKKQTGADFGSRFERAQDLVSTEPATSDPDESDQTGPEESERSWLRNRSSRGRRRERCERAQRLADYILRGILEVGWSRRVGHRPRSGKGSHSRDRKAGLADKATLRSWGGKACVKAGDKEAEGFPILRRREDWN